MHQIKFVNLFVSQLINGVVKWYDVLDCIYLQEELKDDISTYEAFLKTLVGSKTNLWSPAKVKKYQ